MVKLRQAGYCNLKLFLLYLVVYGHWIEPWIGHSQMLLTQYRWIYLIHMPLFAFLSGLFLRNRMDCLRQVKRLLPIYVVLQLAASAFSDGTFDILTPFWHLWYLLSYCIWAGLGWLWFRFGKGKYKLLILIISVLLGALAGFVPWLDRTLSGSRTIVFFPYFWAGLICNQNILWAKYRRWGLAALSVAGTVVVLWGSRIPVTFLYHAAPYGIMKNGFALRLLCYGLGGMLGFFFLTFVTHRRLPCTRAGADTMPGYLIHAPIVGILREINLPWVLCAVLSALLLYIIYKILQWNSPLYGIVPKEGRDRMWPFSKKFTSNTANRYTDSFCP